MNRCLGIEIGHPLWSVEFMLLILCVVVHAFSWEFFMSYTCV